MEIRIASNAGFCFGVRQAIEKAEQLIEDGQGPLATLGPLIHNPQEVSRLENLGIHSYDHFDDMTEKNVILRTHGVTPAVCREADCRGLTTFDCTCPKVRAVQKLAEKYAEDGYQVLILGDANHPEVQGIVGWSGDRAKVFFAPEEIRNWDLAHQKFVWSVRPQKKRSVSHPLWRFYKTWTLRTWWFTTPFVLPLETGNMMPEIWRVKLI